MEVCGFVPTTVHQFVQERDCTAPSFSFLPRKTLQSPNQEICLCPTLIKVGLCMTYPGLEDIQGRKVNIPLCWI